MNLHKNIALGALTILLGVTLVSCGTDDSAATPEPAPTTNEQSTGGETTAPESDGADKDAQGTETPAPQGDKGSSKGEDTPVSSDKSDPTTPGGADGSNGSSSSGGSGSTPAPGKSSAPKTTKSAPEWASSLTKGLPKGEWEYRTTSEGSTTAQSSSYDPKGIEDYVKKLKAQGWENMDDAPSPGVLPGEKSYMLMNPETGGVISVISAGVTTEEGEGLGIGTTIVSISLP